MKKINLLVLVVLSFHLFVVSSFADPSSITVRGESELKIPADRAVISVAVISEAKTSSQALIINSEQVEKVMNAIKRAGLDEKEISTGQFTISPRWSQRPRQAPEDWRAMIVGFKVTNQLQVKTVKLDLVGELVAAAVQAGGNEISGLRFDLADPRQYRHEAIREATRRAKEDARVLADATGASLGRILTLNLDDARTIPVAAPRAIFAEAAVSRMAPPVLPGDVTVHAAVIVVYELNQ